MIEEEKEEDGREEMRTMKVHKSINKDFALLFFPFLCFPLRCILYKALRSTSPCAGEWQTLRASKERSVDQRDEGEIGRGLVRGEQRQGER